MTEHRNNAVFAGSPVNQLPAYPDRNEIVLGKLNVKNETPMGNAHLCKSCSWGQVIAGYRESDLLMICMNTSPNITVPFTVFDCSEFSDERKPTWDEMEKLAIAVEPVRLSTKTRGFYALTKVQPARDDNDEDEAARAV